MSWTVALFMSGAFVLGVVFGLAVAVITMAEYERRHPPEPRDGERR